jgi:hypothetical protein
MVERSNTYIPTAYFLICLIVSVPFNFSNFQLLYDEDHALPGADSAFHTYSILKILDTGNPLIAYTAYPTLHDNPRSFYPSLMHLTVSFIVRISSINQGSMNDPDFVIDVIKAFMMTVSLAGTLGYALLIRTVLDRVIRDKISKNSHGFDDTRYRLIFLIISVLAFSIFIYSISSVIKTYNDGTFPAISAMWGVFPFYMYLLFNNRWVLSSFLLVVIASTHNLSFLMSLSATAPYVISLLFQRTKRLKVNLSKFIIIFLIFGMPALILFYLPATTSVLQGKAAGAVYLPWPIQSVIVQLTPGLFYSGLVSMVLAVVINYRVLGWLSGWASIYFVVFGLSSVLGERFARELSVVFGILVGICVAYIVFISVIRGRKWFSRSTFELNNILRSSGKLVLIFAISATIVSLVYLYFQDRIVQESNPLSTKYFTATIDRSNKFFLTLIDEDGDNASDTGNKMVIALFGENPWLKVTTYGKFDVVAIGPYRPVIGKEAELEGDARIHRELVKLLRSPDVESTSCIIYKYDIDYIYISDEIAGRYYPPFLRDVYYNQLDLFQSISPSPLFDLETEYFGEDGEHLRIFSVKPIKVNQACE